LDTTLLALPFSASAVAQSYAPVIAPSMHAIALCTTFDISLLAAAIVPALGLRRQYQIH
jgi:hypothetical protein